MELCGQATYRTLRRAMRMMVERAALFKKGELPCSLKLRVSGTRLFSTIPEGYDPVIPGCGEVFPIRRQGDSPDRPFV